MIFLNKNYKLNIEVPFVSALILFLVTNRMFEYILNESMVINLTIIAISILLFMFKSAYLTKIHLIKFLIVLFLSNILIFIVYFEITSITLILRNISMLVIGYTVYFYRNNKVLFLLIKSLFLFVIIYYLIFTSLIDVYSFSSNLSYSKNHIGTTVLYISLLFYSFTYRGKKLTFYDLILLVILLRISVWTESRANIIVSVIGLVLYLFFKIKNTKIIFKLLYYSFISVIAIIIISNSDFYLSAFRDTFRNSLYVFEVKGLTDYSRISIIYSYFNSINFVSFLFGKSEWSRLLYYQFGYQLYNLHNSYLLLHYRMGFSGVILGFIIIFNLFKIIKLKRSFMLFILYLMLILRGFSDTIFFDNFDFILYFNIILMTMLSQKINKVRKFNIDDNSRIQEITI